MVQQTKRSKRRRFRIKRELLKNKLYALILIGIGWLSIIPERDGTFLVFALMFGLPLFFSKENWVV